MNASQISKDFFSNLKRGDHYENTEEFFRKIASELAGFDREFEGRLTESLIKESENFSVKVSFDLTVTEIQLKLF